MRCLKTSIILILSIFVAATSFAAVFPFRSFPPVLTSPSEDVNCIYFDSDGMLWAGTSFGLKSFDGYSFKSYQSDAYTPGILPNNTVRSITEDKKGGLWIGTLNGLVRMDRHTGSFHTYFLGGKDQQTIYTLYTSPDGTVWIGTDGGLSYFDDKTGKFHTYNRSNSWVIDAADGRKTRTSNYSVKAILQDNRGDILVGTWNNGLMRLVKGTNTFLRYPRMNERNSAYSLFMDSRHRLWVGSWGNGVIRIDNPRDWRYPHYQQYPFVTNFFDTFMKFVEDRRTNTLWACTREGVCSLGLRNPGAVWQQYTQIGATPLNSCIDIAKGDGGDLWVSTQNSGIIQTTFRKMPFRQWRLGPTPQGMAISYVWSLYTGDGNIFWMGLNPYGIALYNRSTGTTLYNRDIPGFQDLPPITMTTSVTDIVARSNGEIWFAVNSYGVIVYKDGKAWQLTAENSPFIWENFVNTVFESRDRTMWIGTRRGISVMYPDGKGCRIYMRESGKDLRSANVKKITQDKDGTIWVATNNEGIIRIRGNVRKPSTLSFHAYNPANGNFPVDDATACLQDNGGRLWAISNSGGLFLYDEAEDCFKAMNRRYRIPGNRVLAINEDDGGNLWLSTDDALVRFHLPKDSTSPDMMVFSKEDGLSDMLFATNSTFRYGRELYFGDHNGFFSFLPSVFRRNAGKRTPNKLIITNVFVDDMSIDQQDSATRADIADEMPPYVRKLTIPADVKILRVDFSLLTYGNAGKNLYAYKLEGYDDDWHYIGGEHSAVFQNLPAGHYRLRVIGVDGESCRTELPNVLEIRILPPWYASWWAYIIYILLAIAVGYGVVYWYRGRLRTQNRLRTGILLTNITHELMTPLTVVAATVHKLRGLSPQYDDDYQIIDNNISRTTRLLRQILEVRKSQAGQLRLKVSRQDIVSFLDREVEAIRPMAEERKLSLDVIVPDKEIPAWFDKDKLDKIIYNLVSNAIKYNHEDGRVVVSMTVDRDNAVITVHDTGIGMSRDQLRHLYTRFFDGDYRKQNIHGTGIGLALVHELVQLHHGSIDCDSKENVGTTFTVTIPVRKGAYGKDEIDTSSVSSSVDRDTIKELTVEEKPVEVRPQTVFVLSNAPAVLVVEDNDELLELMRQTLSKHYRVLTAKNGKQAWNIIQKEKLDLVITDVMMPVMDGLELLHAIKNDKGFWQLPVILLTAKSREDDKKEGYAAGADAYIVKPFSFDELEVRADSIIANRRKIMEKAAGKVEKEVKAEIHASNPDQVFLDKAAEIVNRHIADADFDRESFAKEMLVSSSTLYNKVRALTGKTIVEFVNDIRLEEAHHIQQQEPGITITELSGRVGFNTPKYFSRLYRKKYGEGDGGQK